MTLCQNRFLVGELYINDPKEIANAFNSYFINIGPSVASHIVTDVSYKDYLSENHATTMKIKFVKEEAVDSIINKLKNKTSRGIDGISNQILKIANDNDNDNDNDNVFILHNHI